MTCAHDTDLSGGDNLLDPDHDVDVDGTTGGLGHALASG